MAKYEFKKGDIVERINSGSGTDMALGTQHEVYDDVSTDSGTDSIYIKRGSSWETWNVMNFKLVSRNGNKIKAKPVPPKVIHIVLKDSCENYIGKFNNYDEAVAASKPSSDSGYTIYKLVPVAKVSQTYSVKKVK
jgi:hypothetical protein